MLGRFPHNEVLVLIAGSSLPGLQGERPALYGLFQNRLKPPPSESLPSVGEGPRETDHGVSLPLLGVLPDLLERRLYHRAALGIVSDTYSFRADAVIAALQVEKVLWRS